MLIVSVKGREETGIEEVGFSSVFMEHKVRLGYSFA